jgi:hypothetical protein
MSEMRHVHSAPGRMCPVDYVYRPSVFDRAPEIEADVLYVVGGLYGNARGAGGSCAGSARPRPWRRASCSTATSTGLTPSPRGSPTIEQGVAGYLALRGNIETEIARTTDVGAGCGCAYPPEVDDATVRRSNEIQIALNGVASAATRARLGGLPMHLVARVGPQRIGIVHGDASRSPDGASPTTRSTIRRAHLACDVRRASNASTCSPRPTPAWRCCAIMRCRRAPHRRQQRLGRDGQLLRARASARHAAFRSALPAPPLYGLVRDGVHIDAIALDFDRGAFLDRFPRPLAGKARRRTLLFPPHRRRSRIRHRHRRRLTPHAEAFHRRPHAGRGRRHRRGARRFAPLRERGAEVIVVDGGSRDDTAACARPSPTAFSLRRAGAPRR